MVKTNLLMLRRFDEATETYYTYFLHGEKRRGCFSRTAKVNFKDDTTIKITKDCLHEIRVLGNTNWKSVGFGEFRLRLASFNAIRKERGWDPVELSS